MSLKTIARRARIEGIRALRETVGRRARPIRTQSGCREVVRAGAATASRTVVLGGVMDSVAKEAPTADITSLAAHLPLEVDTAAEVRPRFHDRWIYGFAIAEAIKTGADPCRYRL